MSSQTTVFKIRFTDHLKLNDKMWETATRVTQEQAKIGNIAKFFFDESAARDDPRYVAVAHARAAQLDGGFYLEDGEFFLKLKCRRAFDLDSAYQFYRQKMLPTNVFPKERIDQSQKRYHSVKSLKPLVFTPSFQYGTIREETEAEFRQALLASDWVAKDILIHCLPGVELACPLYVLFKTFVVKIGAKGEDDQTSDLFYDPIEDKVTASAGGIDVPKVDHHYYFMRIADLLAARRFCRFQEIRDQLVFMEPDPTCLFVTHDWEAPPETPDPHNTQYEELVTRLKGGPLTFHSQQAYYRIGTRTFIGHHPPRTEQLSLSSFKYVWLDYSCMPQRPRDHDDEKLFRQQLVNLNNIFQSGIKVIRIGDKERQQTRSWCVLEQQLAKRNGGISMEFEPEMPVPVAAAHADAIFDHCALPLHGTQVTEPEDRKIIQWMLYKSITDTLTPLSGASDNLSGVLVGRGSPTTADIKSGFGRTH